MRMKSTLISLFFTSLFLLINQSFAQELPFLQSIQAEPVLCTLHVYTPGGNEVNVPNFRVRIDTGSGWQTAITTRASCTGHLCYSVSDSDYTFSSQRIIDSFGGGLTRIQIQYSTSIWFWPSGSSEEFALRWDGSSYSTTTPTGSVDLTGFPLPT